MTETPAPEVTLQHSVLELWSKVLDNIEASAAEHIPLGVARKVVAGWPFLTFAETEDYHTAYHAYLLQVRDVLREIIADDGQAFSWVGDEDAEHNYEHYLELLVRWHLLFDRFEQDWRAANPLAAVQVAALTDARAFVFSGVGLAGHLDAIGFRVSDEEFISSVQAMSALEEVQGE